MRITLNRSASGAVHGSVSISVKKVRRTFFEYENSAMQICDTINFMLTRAKTFKRVETFANYFESGLFEHAFRQVFWLRMFKRIIGCHKREKLFGVYSIYKKFTQFNGYKWKNKQVVSEIFFNFRFEGRRSCWDTEVLSRNILLTVFLF